MSTTYIPLSALTSQHNDEDLRIIKSQIAYYQTILEDKTFHSWMEEEEKKLLAALQRISHLAESRMNASRMITVLEAKYQEVLNLILSREEAKRTARELERKEQAAKDKALTSWQGLSIHSLLKLKAAGLDISKILPKEVEDRYVGKFGRPKA